MSSLSKVFEYQKTGRFFAQAAGKMEDYAAAELKEFGVKEIRPVYRGVWFKTDLEHVYRINYRSKLITRVLAPLITFDCHSTNYLYQVAKRIPWELLLSANDTFAIFSTVSNSKISHTRYASQILKDAVVDYFRDKFAERPDVDRDDPKVWINLHINKNKAKISIDTSGGSLHKRGYRKKSVDAPMQETLAAAIIRLSDWNGKTNLYDPMCGSGTLLCEAAIHYSRIAANYKRMRFGFENLPDFNKDAWDSIRLQSKKLIREIPHNLISGSDVSAKAVDASQENLREIPNGEVIQVTQKDFRELENLENSTIICNPPYGIRMGDLEKLKILYKDFGDFLKQKCKGSTAYIYCGNRELIKFIGLKPKSKTPLMNGNLEGRLLRIEIY
jgi:putative N6-adenine-specific DNA methylase